MNDDDNGNVIKFGAVQGGKADQEDDIPQHNYMIETITGNQVGAKGFLVFTPQHIAIMRNLPEGALPVLVVPLDKVAYTKIVEIMDADNPELPF